MIHPNMATMLGFVATDAAVDPALMQRLVRRPPTSRSTASRSTATPRPTIRSSSSPPTAPATRRCATSRAATAALLRDAVVEVSRRLAQAIVRDGEGATKFITVRVEGGASVAECRQVAFAISHSPLVKTAFFASDPEPRPHPRRRRLRRHRRSRPDPDRPLPRRRARRRRRRAPAELPRGRRPARHEAERDHGARRPAPRRRARRRSGPAT